MKHYKTLLCFILLLAFPAVAAPPKPSFEQWVRQFKQEVHHTDKLPYSLLDTVLRGVKPIPVVIRLDRKQPESKVSFRKYVTDTVSGGRIARGRQLIKENRELLTRIEKHYGVPKQYIIALWGKETDYGRNTGGFSVINALATLAYEGRRSELFRDELIAALTIIQQKHITAKAMRGSWAGAMGQSQFMPSSFLKYAEDFNQDGRRDIWNTRADVFASIANYLSKEGWNTKEGWGRQVILPAKFDKKLADINITKPLSAWKKLGIKAADGSPLPDTAVKASLIQPYDPNAPYFLVYNNYKILLTWNRSRYFATAVGKLADSLE